MSDPSGKMDAGSADESTGPARGGEWHPANQSAPRKALMTITETASHDHGDPAGWDELPDGFTAVIARYLEDEGWHVDDHDDVGVVNVTAADGTETGAWHSGGGRIWTGRCDGHGRCDNPVLINVDVTDPEAIAWGADQEMRTLGLKPGKPREDKETAR